MLPCSDFNVVISFVHWFLKCVTKFLFVSSTKQSGLLRSFRSNAFTDIFCTSCVETLNSPLWKLYCSKPKTHSRLLFRNLCTFLSICSLFFLLFLFFNLDTLAGFTFFPEAESLHWKIQTYLLKLNSSN